MTKILIVDDEPGIRETFQEILEAEGYDITTAAAFSEAESALVAHPYDIVVTDIILPRVNGLALLQRVREIDASIPVIMITGGPNVATATEAMRRGAYDYISKPVTPDILTRVVARAVERKRLLDEKRRLEVENLAYQSDLERKVARRATELEQRHQELAALIDISRAVSATLDPVKVMEIVAENVVTRLGYKAALVSFYAKEDKSFTMGAVYPHGALLKRAIKLVGYDPWKLKFSFDPQANPGFEQLLKGQVWLTTSFHDFVRPVLSKRVADAMQRLYGTRYNVNVPMWVRGKLVGTIMAARKEEIDEAAQKVLASLARQAALAIENGRLFEAERAQLMLAQTLQKVGALLTTRLSLDEVYQHIFDLLSRVIKYKSVSFQLVGADGQLSLLVERGCPDPEASRQIAHELSSRTIKMFAERKVIVIPDTHNDSRWVIAPCTEYIRSWIGAPLLVKGKFIGILYVDSDNVNAYNTAVGETVMAFANQAAIAIENARLFEEEMSSRRLADTLRQVAQALSSTLSLDDVLDLILTELEHVIPLDSGSIMLLEEGQDLIVRAAKGFTDPDSVLKLRLDLDTSLVNREVVESKRPLVIGSVHEDDRWLKAMQIFGLEPELHATCSWMGVPLIVKGQVIGMLTTDKREANFYSARDARIALTFANQAAIAIENARLFEAEQQRRQEAETLHRAAQALATTTLDLSQVFERILSELQQVVPYDSATVQLLQDDRLEIIGGRGFPNLDELLGITFDLSKEDNPNREVVHRRTSFIVDDAPAVYQRFRREPHAAAGIHAWLGVPLLFGERLIGMLALDKQKAGFYTAEHARLAEAFAAQAAIAIENARLYDAAQREIAERKAAENALQERATRLELIARIGRRTTAILKLDELLYQAADLIQDAFGYYNVVIMLVEGDEVVSQAATLPAARAIEKGIRLRVGTEGITGWVAGSGEPLLVPDVSLDTRYHVALEGIETRSELAVPIKLKGIVIGVLDAQSDEIDAFSQSDLFTLQTIAGQLAIAIENAWLYDAAQREIAERKRVEKVLQERATRLELVARVGQRTTAILELDELLDQAANLIGDTFEYHNVNVFLVEGDAIVLRASTFPSYRPSRRLVRLRVGEEGVTGWVAANGEPLLVPDVSVDPRYHVTLEGIETQSELAVPIKLKGLVIGVLDAQSAQLDAFSQADLATLQTIAGQLAVAIENARLYKETKRRVDELVALHNIDIAITSVLDPDEVLQIIYEQVSEMMSVSTFYIGLYDEEKNEFDLALIVEEGERLSLPVFQMGVNDGLSGWVVRTRQPLWVGDMEKERDALPVEPINTGRQTRSIMILPLIARDKVIGVISAQSIAPYAFDESHRRLFSGIASQVAIAIENARLFKETNRRLDELSLLHDVALTAAATLDFDEILRRAVESVNSRLQLDVFGFLLIDEDAGVVRLHPTFLGVPDEMADFSTPLGEGITGWVAQTGQPLLIPDVSQEPRYQKAISAIRSEVCVPLKIGGKIVGVIDAESTQLSAFSEEHVRLFSTLAVQLSVVLENARLFEETNRRLAEARLIQEVALAAASTLDFDIVLERVVKALNRTLGVYHLGFLLPDERDSALVSHPSLVGSERAAFQVPIAGSMAGQAYRIGQPVLARDLAQEPAYQETTPGIHSALAVPVRVGGHIIAVLYAESPHPGAFGEDELRLFTTIAGQLGMAMENARLYQKLEAQTAKLLRAYSELKEINRLRTEMVQNVGHELRTPLGLIKGYAELLLDGDLGPIIKEQRSALEIIYARTVTLTRLIHNLTMLQTLPRDTLILVPLSLVEMVRRAIVKFRDLAEESDILFLENLPDELPLVMGDRQQLELALDHLLDNSVKFSPDGGAITIRAWADQEAVYVSIADEGIGISPEHLERIFERFYQVDGRASRRFGGMGVGLALVWEIVESHGGTIEVKSNIGNGSQFTVALPQSSREEVTLNDR